MNASNKILLALCVIAVGSTSAYGWGFGSPYVPPNPGMNGPVVWGTGPQVTGWNYSPWNGWRPHTHQKQVHGSAYNPTRELGRYNSWNVNRWEQNAQTGGWEHITGQQWVNPITGQIHGDTNHTTRNPDGSSNTTRKFYSRRGEGSMGVAVE